MASYTEILLRAALKKHGFRLTPQRETILNIFQTLPKGKHLSAEDLYELVQRQGEVISLATIYRTVKLMSQMGILRELELAEGHKHYEINQLSPPHHHLVCVRCHQTIEFVNDLVLEVGQKQANSASYDLLDCQLTIHAICPEALQEGWPSSLSEDWQCPRSGLTGDSHH
ncbi:MAG: transcriptional repressor [Oscillatoria sp. SIO1A7]|nr:transcriptional repressor [Oscillatoria sp. SIO1A7]